MPKMYSQLSEKAKKKAKTDYQNGWLQTHPEDFFSQLELDMFLKDTEDDTLYNKDGTICTDEE
jgi:hypothetical protein